jgi:hypothetical protein
MIEGVGGARNEGSEGPTLLLATLTLPATPATAAPTLHWPLALLEPPLDLLARLPASLLLREIRYACFRDLSNLKGPTFIKPADPLNKCFDAGTSDGWPSTAVSSSKAGLLPHPLT